MTKSQAVLAAIFGKLKEESADIDRRSLRGVTFTVKIDRTGVPRAIEYSFAEHKELR